MDRFDLPHHLFNGQRQQRQQQRTDQSQAADLDYILCLPHLLMKRNSRHHRINNGVVPAKDQPCRLQLDTLQSHAASSEGEPTVSTSFLLNDSTVLLIPFPDGSDDYSFPHPLNKSVDGLHENKASDFSSSLESCRSAVHAMIPPDFPIEPRHRRYLEEESGKFLHRVAREAAESGFDVTAYVTCSLDRRVSYDETAKFAKEMETATEGRWRDDDGGVEEMWECPVCLKEMDTSTWSEGVRLLCGHKFHVKCIAPWLTKKTTCPMCRCDQTPIRLLLAQKSDTRGLMLGRS